MAPREEEARASNSGSEQEHRLSSDLDLEKDSDATVGSIAPKTEVDFLVSFSGEDDPRSPKHFSTARKWLIVAIISSTSLCVACTSSLYTGTYGQIEKDLHASEIVTTLGLSIFVVGLGLSPMILAPLSEFYGRKPVYVVSMFFFVIWIIPCAVARNIETLIVARFFNGFAGAAFLSVAGGTVGDLFPKQKLQAPMMVYTASPFLGPELGPVIGNFINSYLDWRWSFYILLIWAFAQWVSICLLVPETYHPVLLRREAQRLRTETGDERYYAPIEKMDKSISQTIIRSCYRPFLLLTLEPMCLCLCLFCSVLLGVLYLFFGAFGLIFKNNYGFNLWQVGLSFLGITVGMIIGIGTNPLWHRNFMRLLQEHQAKTGTAGSSEPEFRLPPAVGGAPLVTIGLLWFAWTTYPSVHWIVPIIGSGIFGAGVIMIFSGVFTFLVDAYPLYAASALAANSFSRSMFAAAFPLFGQAMFRNLGYQWAGFLLAMITLVLAPFPYIFYKWGAKIRQHSRYAGAK
ncbi:major facilitator superfamily domain-containing protein [Aspergillus alliaceus]|uniref:Major facilitator superfamily domain-containing protein n=1 Tax=Petromyces alliaceus TaxID=209559 RepID=A0A5N7C4H1_PETAA|nr:major facilitator superfamily domain-containing protein [Aspergillus alliaceus]